MTLLVHASCVSLEGAGLLLRGPSGAGKSDLALRLIDQGARLVADDQVMVQRSGDWVMASPPDLLAGLLEVRGLGLLKFDHDRSVPLALVIDLIADEQVDRMPEPAVVTLLGCRVPLRALSPWPVSAAIKVRLALQQVKGSIMTVR